MGDEEFKKRWEELDRMDANFTKNTLIPRCTGYGRLHGNYGAYWSPLGRHVYRNDSNIGRFCCCGTD
jgi:hypothetical protein